jgi:hypothetical protein
VEVEMRILQLAFIAALVTDGAVLQQPQAPPAGEIPSPSDWVAFSAEVRGETPAGPYEGRFYRGADGSTRKETGPRGGPIDRIVIVNLTRGEEYSCRKTCTTTSIDEKRPKTPSRMRKIAGLTTLDRPVEGFQAYLWESGTTQTVIPELNFFAVELRTTMVSEKYSNIRVGSQPPELFERPSK